MPFLEFSLEFAARCSPLVPRASFLPRPSELAPQLTIVRSYWVMKRGARVRAYLESVSPTFEFRERPVYETLGRDRIFSADTESLTSGDKLRTLITTLQHHDSNELLESPDGTGMLRQFVASSLTRYGVEESRPSRTAQRDKRADGGRNGRRETVPVALSVWFNFPYDLGRLSADRPEILRSVMVGANSYRVVLDDRYDIEVTRMHFGSSSSFEWFLRDHEEATVARLLGLDLTGYWKTTLRSAAEAAGVTLKKEIPTDWYKKPREQFTAEEWSIFCEYGLGDVTTALELYHATVDLLVNIDERVVTRTGVIPPSAPGAAARIVFAGAFDQHPELMKENGGTGGWERPPTWADQAGCDAYRGARVFCVTPGILRNIITLDIKSAYPYVTACMPDPVTARYRPVKTRTYGKSPGSRVPGPESDQDSGPRIQDSFVQEFRGQWGVLYIDGEGLDEVYPALRDHDLQNRRLRGVYGRFENLAATIPEIVIGVVMGTLRVDRVRGGVVMEGDPSSSFLRSAMAKFFGIKNDKALPKVLQDMAKLLANSTYGKLVEVNITEFDVAEDFPMQNFVHPEVASTIARIYAERGVVDRGYYGEPGEESERVLRSLRYEADGVSDDDPERGALIVLAYLEAMEAAGVAHDGPQTSLGDYMRARVKHKVGQYFMPLQAALITGLTSAMVGAAAGCLGALQGDTDSVHVPVPSGFKCTKDVNARELGLPGWGDFEAVLNEAGYGEEVPGIPQLGQWFCEASAPSSESIFVRPKVYSHRFPDGSHKQAKHGFSKFPRPDVHKATTAKRAAESALHEAIRELVLEGTLVYMSRRAPRRLRSAARNGGEVGEFIQSEVELMVRQDPNTWRDDEGVVRWKKSETPSDPKPMSPLHSKPLMTRSSRLHLQLLTRRQSSTRNVSGQFSKSEE